MRQLKKELSDLEMAFDNSGEMVSYYLDLETGKILSITDDESRLLENLSEDYYDEKTQTIDWETAFKEKNIPEWQRQVLKDADRIEAGFSSRYIAIPSEDSDEGYRDMEAFIATVRNPRLQERLYRAISGRGAFRYFKDVLLDHPTERERWFQFKQERLRQSIFSWLEMVGITINQNRE